METKYGHLLGAAMLCLLTTAAPRLCCAAGNDEQTPGDTAAAAEETWPAWSEDTLTGDWAGERRRLAASGVQLSFVLTADFLRNNTGGIKRGNAHGERFDLTLDVDGGKLFAWQGGSVYLQIIGNNSDRIDHAYVGSLMGVDNNDVSNSRSGIWQAWLQQSFFDDKASLRIGLYAIDSEFYVTESSGAFLHPSFGMAAESADFGTRAGPSIYPTSSYGARLLFAPHPSWYAMFALNQGVNGDQMSAAAPNVSWQRGKGSLLIGEIGLHPLKSGFFGNPPAAGGGETDDYEPISKVAFGAWRFAPRFPQLKAVDASGDPMMTTHWGAYFLAEQTVFRFPDTDRDVTLFFRTGMADGRSNVIDRSTSLGLSVRRPFAGRQKDTFGIAATRAHAGAQGRATLADNLGQPLTATTETALEVNYQASIMAGVVIQPVLQRIFHPGLASSHATVSGVRLRLAF